MNAKQNANVSSGQAEEDARGNSCVQTVQHSVELNACAASPESINLTPAADTTAAAHNLNRKDKDMKANMHHHDKPAHRNGENHMENHLHGHGHGKPHSHHEEETSEESDVAALSDDTEADAQVIYTAADSYGSTGNEAMDTFTDTFTVPEGGASAYAYLQVDDWGSIDISGDNGRLFIDMLEKEGLAGPLGGHKLWSSEKTADLGPGKYTVTVTHGNITMDNPGANASVCVYNIIVTAKGTPPTSSSSSSSS